jgi:hypothetical protein
MSRMIEGKTSRLGVYLSMGGKRRKEGGGKKKIKKDLTKKSMCDMVGDI